MVSAQSYVWSDSLDFLEIDKEWNPLDFGISLNNWTKKDFDELLSKILDQSIPKVPVTAHEYCERYTLIGPLSIKTASAEVEAENPHIKGVLDRMSNKSVIWIYDITDKIGFRRPQDMGEINNVVVDPFELLTDEDKVLLKCHVMALKSSIIPSILAHNIV
ncbi:14331_t:CDS:2 [Entrophospora sp. SA101]|nr:14331_t:CDS:2 [Entrophospora sp. SA101]